MELPPVPSDGHKFFNNTQNAFYKELIASELKTRQSFNDCTATYRSRRNPILSERTPREPLSKRVPRSDTKHDDKESTLMSSGALDATGGLRRSKRLDTAPLATTTSFGGVTGPIAEARMVSLEVARLHKQKEDISMRIREVERLIDYDRRKKGGTDNGGD